MIDLQTILLAVSVSVLTLLPDVGDELPKDSAITETVRKRIAYDDAIRLDDLSTVTSKGVVTLSGFVDSLLAKTQATRIAESVLGTRAVINRLQVEGISKTDEQITQDALDAIRYNPALNVETIQVDVSNGVANLSGSVQSHAESEIALGVVASVAGVKEIQSDVEVEQASTRTDDEIAADVMARLSNSAQVDSQLVKVAVNEGHVQLMGKVPMASQRRLASLLAFVAGVTEVDDSQLMIDPSLMVGVGRQLFQPKNALQIKKAIQDALRYDPRVDANDIQIFVDQGLVRLSGRVATSQARSSAVEDAANTVGVWRVRDQITVEPHAERLDSEIEDDILAAFKRDAYLRNADDLRVESVAGQVSLRGSVATQPKRDRAEQLAGEVQGAKSVANHVEVTSNQTEIQDPLTLKYRIKNRLYWDPLFNECDISVSIDAYGVATLTGWVSNSGQFKAAKRTALDTGATQVDNQILIGK